MMILANIVNYIFRLRWLLLVPFFYHGCVIPSVEPLYGKEDPITNDKILGDWEGNKSVWTFEKRGEDAYYLSYREGNDPINDPTSCTYADFEIHLLTLGKQHYIDFFPINYLNTENLFLLCHLIEMHSFAKIDVGGDEMEVAFLDYRWLKEELETKPDLIQHIWVDDNIIITAGTDELQAFVQGLTDEAYTNTMTLNQMNN